MTSFFPPSFFVLLPPSPAYPEGVGLCAVTLVYYSLLHRRQVQSVAVLNRWRADAPSHRSLSFYTYANVFIQLPQTSTLGVLTSKQFDADFAGSIFSTNKVIYVIVAPTAVSDVGFYST